jgi:hypothetical protein
VGILVIAAGVVVAFVFGLGGALNAGLFTGLAFGFSGLLLEWVGKAACWPVRVETRSILLLTAALLLGAINFVVCVADPTVYVLWPDQRLALLGLGPLNIACEGGSSLAFLKFLERLADVVDNPLLIEKIQRARRQLWIWSAVLVGGMVVGLVVPAVAVVAAVLVPLPLLVYAEVIARSRQAALMFRPWEPAEPVRETAP